MDERASLRIETDQPVRITLLDESEAEFGGVVVNCSRKGLGLRVERFMPPSSPVKIVWANRLLLGEVCYCRADSEGFAAGVDLMHALFDTNELAILARRLLGEPLEQSRGVTTATATAMSRP